MKVTGLSVHGDLDYGSPTIVDAVIRITLDKRPWTHTKRALASYL